MSTDGRVAILRLKVVFGDFKLVRLKACRRFHSSRELVVGGVGDGFFAFRVASPQFFQGRFQPYDPDPGAVIDAEPDGGLAEILTQKGRVPYERRLLSQILDGFLMGGFRDGVLIFRPSDF